MQKIVTYTEMDEKIVGILRLTDDPTTLYAAQRIKELERQLREARDELAAMNEAVSKYYTPSLEYVQPEIERLRTDLQLTQQGHLLAAQERLRLEAEVERLRALVPSPELMQRLAHLDEGYAKCVDEAYQTYEVQAQRIEEENDAQSGDD